MLEPNKNRANDEKRRKTGLEKKLIIAVSIVAIIALVFLVLYFTKRSCSISEEECTDKHCVKAAAEILEFVDLKKDPCQQFYQYVCGHYIKDAVKKDSSTPILQIDKEFKNEMKGIVIDPIKKKDTKPNRAMKNFYQACMNESKIDADKDQTFKEAIGELGGWPMINGSNWDENSFDWVEWHIKSVKLGVPIIGFFHLEVADVSEQNNTFLKVSGSNIINVNITKNSYEYLMKDIARAFEAPDGFGSEIMQVYDFLRKLRKLSEGIPSTIDDDEEIKTIEDLEEICPEVPWLKILNDLSGENKFNKSSEIVLELTKTYCEGLDKLLRDTSSRVIADYFVWSIIQNSYNFMSRKIRNAYEDLKDENEDRFTICYSLTDKRFAYLKETVYIRKKIKPEVRVKLEELVEIMKEVFIEHIKVSTWMDEETKKNGIEKAEAITKIVGADESLYDMEEFDKVLGVDELEFSSDNPYQILKEKNIKENKHLWDTVYGEPNQEWKDFFSRANSVNAFFAQAVNIMIIPAPILNSVFFNYKMPAFMNFGSIGRVVGHEIMHGFAEEGRHVLVEDEMVDWWTNATAEGFNETKQCAIKAYEKVPFRYKLNGTLTLEENIADIVGIDVAYEAYQKWVKKHGAEKKLPGIPLTPNQIFWIQTGTFLCFRKLDDDDVDMEAEDEHGIPQFRVTAGAKNSRYFAKDFNCPEGSHMNPKEKCRIL